ncbi:MAG: phosphotransferase family protein [Deltaproteobacteria bacterium]|nr:phosphotransferase family protein [Deltaproteobacteria bacterium]
MDFQAQLQSFLTRVTGDRAASVEELRRHTQGFSMETMSFVGCWRDHERSHRRRLVLRRQPEAGLLEPYDLRPQVAAMRALQGVMQVPPLLWFEEDPAVLGAPFYVMEFVEGDVPLPMMAPGAELPIPDAATRERLAGDLASNLVALHRFDWRGPAFEIFAAPAGLREAAQMQVEVWRGYYQRSRPDPSPMLERALRELDRRAREMTERGPVSIVHGDFRTGNFLRQGTRVTAVLDWELVHLGDPMEDLAWACSRLWRGQTDLAGLLVPRARFVEMYREAGGGELDSARLAFYDLLGAVKMAAIMLTGIRAFADERTDDARMAIFAHQLDGLGMVIGESLGLVPSLSS